MAMSDLIADCLTRIRNAQHAGHEQVEVKLNSLVNEILKILKDEGLSLTLFRIKTEAKEWQRLI